MAVRFDRRERERLRALIAEVGVLRLDGDRSLRPVFEDLRAFAELDTVGFYSVRNRVGAWELADWQLVGTLAAARPLYERVLAASQTFPVYYDPRGPAPSERNRVLDAYAWIEKRQPGIWETNAVATEVMRPFRAHRWHQPRALLCKGRAFLGWFGGIHADAPTPRQLAVLGALVEPLCDRFDAERRLASSQAQPALDALMERLGSPAFQLDARGRIEHANSAGRTLLADGTVDVRRLLRDAVAKRRTVVPVEVLDVEGCGASKIAIVNHDSPGARIVACVKRCTARWRLTPRQAEVLEHVVRGRANATIAMLLVCVERTVELHVSALLDRAGVDSRAALVAAVLTTEA